MKRIILFVPILFLCEILFGQSTLPLFPGKGLRTIDSTNKEYDPCKCQLDAIKSAHLDSARTVDYYQFEGLDTWAFTGIGNLNSTSASNLNGSGAISATIRPAEFRFFLVQTDLTFNINATNSDSLLSTELIFPESGSSNFYGRLTLSGMLPFCQIWNNYHDHDIVSIYYEFASKAIKDKTDSSLNFSVYSHTLGLTLAYLYADKTTKVGVSASGYFSFIQIPVNSVANYTKLYNKFIDSTVVAPTYMNCSGLKITLQVNQFSIFADFRNVYSKNVTTESLRGPHLNFGIAFNATIF